MNTPEWLRVLLCLLSPSYRSDWEKLEQRSGVTGVAREEKVIWQGLGYRWVLSREVKKRNRP